MPHDRPRPRTPTIVTTMTDLAAAHVSVRPANGGPGHVRLTVTGNHAAVVLIDAPAVLRQLLTDGVAQLDAINPRSEETR